MSFFEAIPILAEMFAPAAEVAAPTVVNEAMVAMLMGEGGAAAGAAGAGAAGAEAAGAGALGAGAAVGGAEAAGAEGGAAYIANGGAAGAAAEAASAAPQAEGAVAARWLGNVAGGGAFGSVMNSVADFLNSPAAAALGFILPGDVIHAVNQEMQIGNEKINTGNPQDALFPKPKLPSNIPAQPSQPNQPVPGAAKGNPAITVQPHVHDLSNIPENIVQTVAQGLSQFTGGAEGTHASTISALQQKLGGALKTFGHPKTRKRIRETLEKIPNFGTHIQGFRNNPFAQRPDYHQATVDRATKFIEDLFQGATQPATDYQATNAADTTRGTTVADFLSKVDRGVNMIQKVRKLF